MRNVLRLGVLFALVVALVAGNSVPAPALIPVPETRDDDGQPLPEYAVARLGSQRWRTPAIVNALAYTPDSKTLVGVHSDGTLIAWDAASGYPRWHWTDRSLRHAQQLVFCQGGQVLAVLGQHTESELHLFDAQTGVRLPSLRVENGITALCPDEQGERLLIGGWGGIALWDPRSQSRRQLTTFDPGKPVDVAALAPQGIALLQRERERQPKHSTYDLWFHDAFANKVLRREGQGGGFSPGGRWLVRGSCSDARAGVPATVEVADASTGRLTWGHAFVKCYRPEFAISHDDALVALAGDGAIQIVSLATRQVMRTFPTRHLERLTFAPAGTSLAGRQSGGIGVLDLTTGQVRGTTEEAPRAGGYTAFSADGGTLYPGYWSGPNAAWDIDTGQTRPRILSVGKQPHFLGPRGGAYQIVTCADQVALWRTTGEFVRTLTAPANDPVYSMALSPDGKLLAVGGQQGRVRLTETETGRVVRTANVALADAYPDLYTLAFSPDGQYLLGGGSFNCTVHTRLWRVADLQEVWHRVGEDVAAQAPACAFSPDARWLAVRSQNYRALLEVATGKQRALRDSGGPHCAFLDNGRLLACVDRDAIVVWDLALDRARIHLRGHLGPIVGVAYHPATRRLASVSSDTALVWDMTPFVRESTK